MPLFTPTLEYNPDEPINSVQGILVEYVQWGLDQYPNAEDAVVTKGFPNFDGKLPLQTPRVCVYMTPGGYAVSVGYDDIFDPSVDGQIERGEYHVHRVNVDCYTSVGTRDRPSKSGGLATRDRLQGYVFNLFSRNWYQLPENFEVVEKTTRYGIRSEPMTETDLDLCLGRVTFDLRVPSTYRIDLP